MDLNITSSGTLNADLTLTLDEISDTILEQLRVPSSTKSSALNALKDAHNAENSSLMCSSCHTAPATRLVHHLLFFDDAQPPRVEDLPTPVCPSLQCEMLSSARHWMELETAISLEPRMRHKYERGLPGCFFCHEKAAKVTRTTVTEKGSTGATNSTAPAPPLLRCSRCHIARYCSTECQRKDWPIHKHLCGKPMPS